MANGVMAGIQVRVYNTIASSKEAYDVDSRDKAKGRNEGVPNGPRYLPRGAVYLVSGTQ